MYALILSACLAMCSPKMNSEEWQRVEAVEIIMESSATFMEGKVNDFFKSRLAEPENYFRAFNVQVLRTGQMFYTIIWYEEFYLMLK